MTDEPSARQFYAYLLFTLAMASGAVLANNLVLLLFFGEGLLLTQFAMIADRPQQAYKTAVKAFIILGVTDLADVRRHITGRLAAPHDVRHTACPRRPGRR